MGRERRGENQVRVKNSFHSANRHRRRRRGSCGAERGGRRVRLQHRRTPETHRHTTTDAVGGVRGKIPIFPLPPPFLFSLVDDDAAARPTPILTPLPLLPSTTLTWGRRLQLKRANFKSSLLPVRFILLPPSSRLMLHSHLRQNNTAQPGQEGSGYSGLNAHRAIAFFVLTIIYFHNNR